MAMQFKDTTDDNVGFEEMLKSFRKAVEDTGFNLIRVDDPDVQKTGLIDDQIRVEIRNSAFVVADLTYGNQGAYWEAGFAQGLDKKVFYTCSRKWFYKEKTENRNGVHFDVEHENIIFWEKDNLKEVAERLKYAIRNSLPDVAKMEDYEKTT
jgi:nucleoside 2-deoxyribosyltransferase